MKIEFFGVIGSSPGGASDLGKNTTCLVIKSQDKKLIVDAGTGIINYFNFDKDKEHHLLLTHYHLDHVIGLPFSKVLFDKSCNITIYGPNLEGFTPSDILSNLLRKPFLPIPKEDFISTFNYSTLLNKKSYMINSFKVETLHVQHPGGCMVYSIYKENKKISILTDLPNSSDANMEVINFVKNSDLLYIDSQFLESEMTNGQHNFGHSTVESAIRLKTISNSKKVILGHHKNNRLLKEISQFASTDIIIAKEGNEVEI